MSAVCRVCLTGIIKLNYLEDNLINLYEKLTETKFISEDARPRALCCLCYQKLLGCHTFSQLAHRSETIFSQLFNKGLEATPEDITEFNLGMEHHLSVATRHSSVDESSVTFKDQQITVKKEVTTEEDPLMKVASVSPEDCTKIESAFHQKTNFTRPHVYRNKRKYIRKNPEAAPISEAVFKEAQKLIKDGKSQRAAAALVGISEACLRHRLKRGTVATSMGRFKPTFNIEQELEFAKHCKDMDDRFFGVTINNLRKLAYEYADANKIENRFDKSSKMAGRDWVDGFLERNPQLAVRRSAPRSLVRANGFNKVQVEHFYKNLKELYTDKKIAPSRIYNMDETSMSTVPIKTTKVVATKGKKVVGKVSAERAVTVTVICCMSACGHYVPPAFIYPLEGPRNDLLDDGPAQSIGMVSDSGYVNTELFFNWLHHFQYFAHPTPEDPVLLILDNHSSHVSLDAVNYARENNIVMVTLPPHASHKLQPLDRSFFSPLKKNYSIECEKQISLNPGRPITQYHVAGLFNRAFKKVATIGNAESGFRVTGIWPFDDNLFNETESAPSKETDQATTENITELNLRMEDEHHLSVADRQLTTDDTINESSVTFYGEQISVKEEVTIEDDPLMKVESVSLEDCTKIESSVEVSRLGNYEELPHTFIEQTKQFKCNLCNKQFSLKINLIRHLQSHAVEKSFTCNICDKQFKHSFALVRHKIAHSVEKPFTCNVCDKQFKQKSGLVRHKIIHTGEKRFTCNVCGKQLCEKENLVNHLRIHTGEKPFACDICDKTFNQKSALLRHTMIHTGKKPYTCDACDKQFSVKNKLVVHMRIHTGEKPFACVKHAICKATNPFKKLVCRHHLNDNLKFVTKSGL